MSDQPGESGHTQKAGGSRPDGLTGYAAAVSGYLIGTIAPPLLMGVVIVIFGPSAPDPAPNCWDGGGSYCERTWLLGGIFVLVSLGAVLCTGPVLCRFALVWTGQPGALGTALGTLALAPLYLIALIAASGGGGVRAFVLGVLVAATVIPILVRTIWWALDRRSDGPAR